MKLRHSAALTLTAGALFALAASVLFPSTRWQAIWTIVTVLFLAPLQILIAGFGRP
jgi:hypothetical protein